MALRNVCRIPQSIHCSKSRLIVLVSAHINRSSKAKSFHDKIKFKLTLLSSIYQTTAFKVKYCNGRGVSIHVFLFTPNHW